MTLSKLTGMPLLTTIASLVAAVIFLATAIWSWRGGLQGIAVAYVVIATAWLAIAVTKHK